MAAPQAPIRLGLVGLNFGRHICRQLTEQQNLPVRLVQVCDLDESKAAEVAATCGVTTAPNLDALIQDPAIDAIGLFTGPNGRAELIRKIIRAGKDVMTTKPFERDAQAALSVLREARELGRVVHLNSPNARPFGEMAAISRWVADGVIGTPTLAQSSVWVYYGPTPADGSWYDDPALCPAAPLFRLGIYPLNNLLTLFGTPVSVQLTHARVETQRPTPDNASVTIGFADGAIVTLSASFVVGGPDIYRNTMVIAGTRGVIYFNTGPKPRETTSSSQLILSTNDRIEHLSVTVPSGEYDWDFFAQRVRSEVADDITTPAQIVTPIRVMQAISQAERTGLPVTLSMEF